MVEGYNLLHHTSYIIHLIVVPGRLELPTSTLSVWRSNQLSYETLNKAAPISEGFSSLGTSQRVNHNRESEDATLSGDPNSDGLRP